MGEQEHFSEVEQGRVPGPFGEATGFVFVPAGQYGDVDRSFPGLQDGDSIVESIDANRTVAGTDYSDTQARDIADASNKPEHHDFGANPAPGTESVAGVPPADRAFDVAAGNAGDSSRSPLGSGHDGLGWLARRRLAQDEQFADRAAPIDLDALRSRTIADTAAAIESQLPPFLKSNNAVGRLRELAVGYAQNTFESQHNLAATQVRDDPNRPNRSAAERNRRLQEGAVRAVQEAVGRTIETTGNALQTTRQAFTVMGLDVHEFPLDGRFYVDGEQLAQALQQNRHAVRAQQDVTLEVERDGLGRQTISETAMLVQEPGRNNGRHFLVGFRPAQVEAPTADNTDRDRRVLYEVGAVGLPFSSVSTVQEALTRPFSSDGKKQDFGENSRVVVEARVEVNQAAVMRFLGNRAASGVIVSRVNPGEVFTLDGLTHGAQSDRQLPPPPPPPPAPFNRQINSDTNAEANTAEGHQAETGPSEENNGVQTVYDRNGGRDFS